MRPGPGFLHFEALGLFLDWYTLITQNIISLDTEKLARRSFQHGAPSPPPHWKNGGGGVWVPPGSNDHEFLRLTDWLGVSTVELCGRKKRNLGGILRYVWAQKWGVAEIPFRAPLPGKWGGGRAPLPPCSCAYGIINPLKPEILL